jgi:hypothetical protein
MCFVCSCGKPDCGSEHVGFCNFMFPINLLLFCLRSFSHQMENYSDVFKHNKTFTQKTDWFCFHFIFTKTFHFDKFFVNFVTFTVAVSGLDIGHSR